jgi:hypothetical protein
MLPGLTAAQRALADYMSELSEEAYSAGWMLGLEYALWDAVFGQSDKYDRSPLGVVEVARLRELAGQSAGWIVFDVATEETWLPMVEWEQRFDEWVKRGRRNAG